MKTLDKIKTEEKRGDKERNHIRALEETIKFGKKRDQKRHPSTKN